MASNCITFPAREGLAKEINKLAKEWGYKHYGNGGYTTFIAEVLDAVVQSQHDENAEFRLETILAKKTKAHRRI